MSFKEIQFDSSQVGKFGIAITNPFTNDRALVGIFETREEAEKDKQIRSSRGKDLRIVVWSKRIYDKYDYVFDKDSNKPKLEPFEKLFLEGFKISREGANAECLMIDHLAADGAKDIGYPDDEIWESIKSHYKKVMKGLNL